MALESGTRLGSYEIVSSLGSGGMGDVYKAKDLKLGRIVALKVLPEKLASDPERLSRFEREARAASALDHPNIITIHDISETDGIHFIVMQYVEGKTLRHLLQEEQLDLKATLHIALQVTDGLALAHSKGIVHRDLKPDNIMLTSDRLVKILDFGLAKLTEMEEVSEASTRDMGIKTKEGHIIGTAPYMSPEQAQGKSIDARSDIFSFGSVLYEMVTGRRAYPGDSMVTVLAAIVRDEPVRVSELVPSVPLNLEKAINRTMRKEPERRYQSMADLKVELQEIKEELELGSVVTAAQVARPAKRISKKIWVGIAAGVMVVGVGLWMTLRVATPPPPPPSTIPLTSFEGFELDPAISPDGKQVAYVWRDEARFHLYVQLLSGGQPLQLTDAPASDRSPTWSPDGSQIAFIRRTPGQPGQEILAIPALGGSVRRLATSPYRGNGLDWSPDGKLLALSHRASPDEPVCIFLLSMETGEMRKLTAPPTSGQPRNDIEPTFSPDGRTLAFIRELEGSGGVGGVYIQYLDDDGAFEVPSPDGFTWDVDWTANGDALVYSKGRTYINTYLATTPIRGGEPSRLPYGERARYVSIARQGGLMVFSRWLEDNNIWRTGGPLVEEQSPPTKLIASTLDDGSPVFSPDGTKIAFISDRRGSWEVWVADGDGSNPRQLTDRGHAVQPAWSPDSQEVVFSSVKPNLPAELANELGRTNTSDVYIVDGTGGFARKVTEVRRVDALPAWSSDGRWIYHQSDRGDERQIWKTPVEGGDPIQLTTSDGMKFTPIEADDGRVFYWCNGSIWSVPVDGGEEKRILDENVDLTQWRPWDGKLFYVRQNRESGSSIVELDWQKQEKKVLHSFDPTTQLGMGLTVSPDGRWILYTQTDQDGSDLVLVENFY